MVVVIVGCIIIITLCKSNELFLFFFFLRLDDIVRRELCVLNIPSTPKCDISKRFLLQTGLGGTDHNNIIDNYTSTHPFDSTHYCSMNHECINYYINNIIHPILIQPLLLSGEQCIHIELLSENNDNSYYYCQILSFQR